MFKYLCILLLAACTNLYSFEFPPVPTSNYRIVQVSILPDTTKHQSFETNSGVPLTQIQSDIIGLIQSSYQNYTIDVQLTNEVVTITGKVNSEYDRKRIEQDILNINGVKKVDNQLQVRNGNP